MTPNGPRPNPIIAMAPTVWRGTWMNRQHLLSRLARRGWPIVYSTGPASLWERGDVSWAARPLCTNIEAVDGISLVTGGRSAPDWPRLPILTTFSRQVHARALRGAAGAQWHDNGILYLFHPSFEPFIGLLKPKFVAFHVFDVYAEMEEWDAQLERQLVRICERANLLTAASDAMGDALPEPGRSKVRVLPNGVDLEPYADAEHLTCPADLAGIPSPRIANVGTLNLKIDFAILADVAAARPDWNLVFVGPVNEGIIAGDPEAAAAFRRLRNLRNTHFLGGKDRTEVPAYMAHMDVNLVCYLIREGHWASKGYPLKLNEYLAVRKPVVATPTDAIRRYFGSVVDIADDGPAFVAAIERALAGNGRGSPDERWAMAASNTWDGRVSQLDRWLAEVTGSDDGP